MQKSKICCSYQHQKVSFGKNDEVATKHKCTSSIIIGIILLRLYDNLFFSSRKESKELMLKETASPLNGFFYFDFLGERGFKGNIYRCLLPQYQLKNKILYIYNIYTTTLTHNQPNPISLTARSRLAWLLLHTILI